MGYSIKMKEFFVLNSPIDTPIDSPIGTIEE